MNNIGFDKVANNHAQTDTERKPQASTIHHFCILTLGIS